MANVREFGREGSRSAGRSVVWAGLDDGPALVVIDPSGAANHDELPATWRELADGYQIAWCRIPASDRVPEDVEDVVETLAQQQTTVDLVAAGTSCAVAIGLADEFAPAVRSVLLVDPESEPTTVTVPTRVVARSHPGADDRVPPPLPLGHPDVVEAVRAALLVADEN